MLLKESLNFSFNSQIESAYIISLSNNSISKKYTAKCIESCKKVGMPYQVFEGFDGTNKKTIKVPKSLEKQNWVKWIKVLNSNLKITEVCCFLSHLALWIKCIELDKPLVILEHDAVMVKPFTQHPIQNCIVYLGARYQLRTNNFNTIFGQLNQNYRFIYCGHAYSVDPIVAKNLVSRVIETGITHTLDSYIRADIFTIQQTGFYAYNNEQNETVIHNCQDIMLNNYMI